MQKVILDLGLQRRELRRLVTDLWNVTEKQGALRAEEERRQRVMEHAMSEGGVGLKDLFAKAKKQANEVHFNSIISSTGTATLRRIAAENDMPLGDAEFIQSQFKRFDVDDSGFIEKREFVALLNEINDSYMTEMEIQSRWNSFLRFKSDRERNSRSLETGKDVIAEAVAEVERSHAVEGGKTSHVGFEHFIVWYWETMCHTYS